MIDEKLTFEKHVEYIQRKVIPRLKLLGNLRNIVSQNISLTIYKTMVAPLFDYCDVVLGALPPKSQFKLQKLQNSACQILLRQGPRGSVTQMDKELKLDYLSVRRSKHILNHVYNGVNDLFPAHICNRLTLVKQDSVYATGASETFKLKIPQVKLKLLEQNFFYQDPVL